MDLVRCVVPSSCGVRGRIVSAIILDRLNAVSIRAALLAALAVCLFPMGTAAQAEPFEPQYRAWEGYDYAPFSPPDRAMGDSEPLSQKRQRAHTKHESRPKAESQPRRAHTIDESRPKAESQRQRAPKGKESEPKAKVLEVAKGPLQIIISIADQRISVYDDGTLIARSSVSTGVPGHPHPSAYSASSARNFGIAQISTALRPCPTCSGSLGQGLPCMLVPCPAIRLHTAAFA
jgi:hypothetical protein